ncbi:metalloregulator ArsR/SmtB family transcription factor [Halioglobus maricola]|uniref:Metalloregulator ArsR/SmtB family transcription factor n=1 Tax=Halioglobus maricola TaxID=2601894 RepID=A0A5P9NFG8_9GAMM|nr:metalloregulator ArsR/SmtB family transcription factor [Halioglobus maricola]QFU74236.1 metalloregulator ArsR/SmtB family transcription factor [Halioglobus maricola]
MDPQTLFKCLADETRLKTVLLIRSEDELCVCELTEALEVSQPKVSRHLAQLRDSGLLATRRAGQWIYYSINTELPAWAAAVIETTANHNATLTNRCCKRLEKMGDRPERDQKYCGATV